MLVSAPSSMPNAPPSPAQLEINSQESTTDAKYIKKTAPDFNDRFPIHNDFSFNYLKKDFETD